MQSRGKSQTGVLVARLRFETDEKARSVFVGLALSSRPLAQRLRDFWVTTGSRDRSRF